MAGFVVAAKAQVGHGEVGGRHRQDLAVQSDHRLGRGHSQRVPGAEVVDVDPDLSESENRGWGGASNTPGKTKT